ncbi:MAG: hypothetical protein WC421_04950 [Elusimicrobiales bacterium]
MKLPQLEGRDRIVAWVAAGMVLAVAGTWWGLFRQDSPPPVEMGNMLRAGSVPEPPARKISQAAIMLPGEAARGHISVRQERDFVGAMMPPKPVSEVLAEMAAAKKIPAVSMKESDLSRHVSAPGTPSKNAHLSLRGAPPGQAKSKSLPSAPVSAKVFRDQFNYSEFGKTHPATPLPKADFSRQIAVMLVSISEFPSKIFEPVGASERGGAVTVTYRVNPLAATDDGNSYPVLVVNSRAASVKLEQVP